MKYVQLFESWLSSVNEAINTTKLNQLGLKYESDAEYTKSPDAFAKHLVKTLEAMLANAPEDYRIKLEAKTQIKKITLSTKNKEDESPSTFKFEFDKKTFSTVGDYILGIKGEGNAFGKYQNETTIAQFVYSVITGKELKEFNQNDDSFTDAVEELTVIAGGKRPTVLTGNTGSKNISKMTADEFYALPEKAKMELFKAVLKDEFIMHKTFKENIFLVTPSEKLAKKYNLKHDSDSSMGGGRYFAVKLEKPEDGKETMANIPVSYGASDIRNIDTTEDIYNPAKAKSVKGFDLTPQKTTLAAFIFRLLDLVSNDMKYTYGKEQNTFTSDLDFQLAIKLDDSDATKKKASEAWQKPGGSADMSLKTADASKETTT